MERLERELMRKLNHHRAQAEYFRRKAVDRMTWKQFQPFNESGIYKGRSKRIQSLLEFSADERKQAAALRRRLDTLLDLSVIQGERCPWLPSNPVGELREVSNA